MASHKAHYTDRGVTMIDVGHKMDMPQVAGYKDKKSYPTLHLDKHIPGLDKVAMGGEAIIMAKVRLQSIRKDEHGEGMGLEVREVKDVNPGPGGRGKVHKVMSEYKHGSLKSSSGAKVRSRKQAIAIAMSEAGISRKKKKKGKK